MSKIHLSYSTLNATINCPHTWIMKQLGMKTFTTTFFEEGKAAHDIIGKSVTGESPLPVLADLPEFELRETKDFDEKMRITLPIDEKYDLIGYVDLLSHKYKRFADIKSSNSVSWGAGKMAKHPQFILYSMALGYPDFFLINCPRDPDTWNKDNIKVSSMSYTNVYHALAIKFIRSGISVIENIKEAVDQEKDLGRRSPFCFFKDCFVCSKYDNHYNKEII